MNPTLPKAVQRSPGSRETPSARALKRRALIKQAVAAVLERVGYRAMKVTDVAAEAGIAVGLFYHYFPDLCAATCEVLTDLVDDLSHGWTSCPNPKTATRPSTGPPCSGRRPTNSTRG
jgi:hypothetical protein